MADVHPIRNEVDYERALAEIDTLIKQSPDGETPEGERLELLSVLVSDYEARHDPIQPPDDPIAVIEFYMDKDGLSRKDLEAYLGNKARVSDILNRRRSLSLSMIRRLSAGLGIPADLLIGSTRPPSRRQNAGARVSPHP